MNLEEIIKHLEAERDRITRALEALQDTTTIVLSPSPTIITKITKAKAKDKSFRCKDCGKSYTSNSAMNLHRRKKHPKLTTASEPDKTLREFQCIDCGDNCTGRQGLREHQKTCKLHLEERKRWNSGVAEPDDAISIPRKPNGSAHPRISQ